MTAAVKHVVKRNGVFTIDRRVNRIRAAHAAAKANDEPRDDLSKRYNRAAREKRLQLYAVVAMLARDDDTAIAYVRHRRVIDWIKDKGPKP